ncbi:putative RNA-binding protein 18 isoform X3 [Phascolarctos cinereus]
MTSRSGAACAGASLVAVAKSKRGRREVGSRPGGWSQVVESRAAAALRREEPRRSSLRPEGIDGGRNQNSSPGECIYPFRGFPARGASAMDWQPGPQDHRRYDHNKNDKILPISLEPSSSTEPTQSNLSVSAKIKAIEAKLKMMAENPDAEYSAAPVYSYFKPPDKKRTSPYSRTAWKSRR